MVHYILLYWGFSKKKALTVDTQKDFLEGAEGQSREIREACKHYKIKVF